MHLAQRLTILLLLAGIIGSLAPQQARAQASEPRSLEERLTLGLKARLPGELDFIAAVVATVERGEMSRKLVDRFFFWARKKSSLHGGPKKQRPIIYFQAGLQIQAKRLGIKIRK